MEIKIHKRVERNVIVGETMKCGLTYFDVSPNCSFRWKDVTCKNCLKLKKDGEKS